MATNMMLVAKNENIFQAPVNSVLVRENGTISIFVAKVKQRFRIKSHLDETKFSY